MEKYIKFTDRVDRRSPRNEAKEGTCWLRENILSRDGRNNSPKGTERLNSTGLNKPITWIGRYYTVESGSISPKTFCYSQDGKLYTQNELTGVMTEIKSGLNTNAYPKHWLYKSQTQTKLYLVDGLNLYEYDGNNNNTFNKITITDTDGKTINPIDVIEHLDRLILISNTFYYVSKNLNPIIFNDSTDSIQGIVGSGKGLNLALGKIEDSLFFLNTEGIFRLIGDTISAVASTFDIELVEERKIIASGSAQKVEKAILFIADDLELWSFDGSNSKLLSYSEKLKDFINPIRDMLNKMTSTYENNYYKLSFVENGYTYNNLEVWWDALEDKIDFVRGRNVGSYLKIDPTRESIYYQYGRSDFGYVMWANRGYNFDGVAIRKRLISNDIVISKGDNVRFTEFFPVIEPTGVRNLLLRYVLDGRISDLDDTAKWTQDLSGEAKFLGLIRINNQNQMTERVKPKINYSRGESISFEIFDNSLDLEFSLLGIGISYTVKKSKKGKKIGQ